MRTTVRQCTPSVYKLSFISDDPTTHSVSELCQCAVSVNCVSALCQRARDVGKATVACSDGNDLPLLPGSAQVTQRQCQCAVSVLSALYQCARDGD